VAFHESFWLATSAAAPVIALAAVVALPDLSNSPRAVSVLRVGIQVQSAYDEIKRRKAVSGDTSELSVGDLLKSVTDDPLKNLTQELRLMAEPPWDRLRTLASVHQWLSFGNVITQAGLLAMSLAALAYARDVVPLWVAITLAVGGILLLAGTSVAGASIRIQLKSWEPGQSSDQPPEGSSAK
jgi:hypothetical protein